MKPYYSDDLVTIYHGDCREWMPEADVIVTDPPYGIAYSSSSSRSVLAKSRDHPPIYGDTEPFDPAFLLARKVPTVLWGGNHYCSRLPDSPSWLVWDKRVDLGSNDSADCEMAWTNLGGPARVFRHRWQGMLRDSERGQSYHPTQKPVAVMRWVLGLIVPPTMRPVYLDPFMGAGATLVAAKDWGFRAIGIEIEERYCEIAANRCRQEVLGLSA